MTGGATGIGAAAVQVLGAAGARVVATDHHTPPPEHSEAVWLQCEATDPSSVDIAVSGAVDALGGLAVLGSPMSTIYAASKAVETPGAQRLRDFLGPDLAPVVEQQIQLSIPLGGKSGDPIADLGPMLVFLAGDGSRFITGQLLAVDGGLMMLGA